MGFYFYSPNYLVSVLVKYACFLNSCLILHILLISLSLKYRFVFLSACNYHSQYPINVLWQNQVKGCILTEMYFLDALFTHVSSLDESLFAQQIYSIISLLSVNPTTADKLLECA